MVITETDDFRNVWLSLDHAEIFITFGRCKRVSLFAALICYCSTKYIMSRLWYRGFTNSIGTVSVPDKIVISALRGISLPVLSETVKAKDTPKAGKLG